MVVTTSGFLFVGIFRGGEKSESEVRSLNDSDE